MSPAAGDAEQVTVTGIVPDELPIFPMLPPRLNAAQPNKKAPANRGFLCREAVAQYWATVGPPKR